jgi:hypothetical protein
MKTEAYDIFILQLQHQPINPSSALQIGHLSFSGFGGGGCFSLSVVAFCSILLD